MNKESSQLKFNKQQQQQLILASASFSRLPKQEQDAYPLLVELAKREDLVRSGKLSTILFLRCHNKRAQEISGYIDYGQRLVQEATNTAVADEQVQGQGSQSQKGFSVYFDVRKKKRKKLKPNSTDLSFYNWETQAVSTNNSNNFQVIPNTIDSSSSSTANATALSSTGLLFKHKRDRKLMNVDPTVENIGDNSSRTEIQSKNYAQIVIFDHWTRRRT
jgi:hypothetical protein